MTCKHQWTPEMEPEELKGLSLNLCEFGCPLCIMEAGVKSATIQAQEFNTPEAWAHLESESAHYSVQVAKFRERLTPEQQRALDRETVAEWLASF